MNPTIHDPDATPGMEDPRLGSLIDEYLSAIERGEHPNRHEYAARFPELAEAVHECLDGLELVQSAAPKSRMDPEHTAKPIGDFRVIAEIGRGGMGIVYEAEQISLGRRVALKVLPFAAALDPKHLQRFRNEAHAAATLHHTNIVPVYAVGSERGVHFYAMQLIEGRTVAAVIRELRMLARDSAAPKSMPSDVWPGETQSERTASLIQTNEKAGINSTKTQGRTTRTLDFYRTTAQLMVQAANALHYAHEMGVVHRDIKPANLIMDHRGNVWITDFGLAQLPLDAGLTMTGDVLGTLRYMSPEQALGKGSVLDHRTDVYSLGATLYELLTLEPAVPGDDRAEVLSHLKDDDPKPPRDIDSSIPIELETIVLKALAKLPAERYQSCQEMADDLNRFLADLPIMARRPTVWERMQKWSRRHRAWITAASVMLVLATIGFAVSTALIAHAYSQTNLAFTKEKERAKEAARDRALAMEHFFQARQAVDFLTQIGEEELSNSPWVLDLRRKILETALAYYNKFVEQGTDNPALKADLDATRDRIERFVEELRLVQRNYHSFARVDLLSWTTTREDLETTNDQNTKLDAIRETVRGQESFPSVSGQQANVDRLKAQRLRFDEVDNTIDKILTVAQQKRVSQIMLQMKGEKALLEPEVSKTLQLTSTQMDRIKELMGSFKDFRGRYDRVLKELTEEQIAKWNEMIGKPFRAQHRSPGKNRRSDGRSGKQGPEWGPPPDGPPPPKF